MAIPRSGFAGAVTRTPAASRRSTTPFQLEASAKAPWTRTTVRGAASDVVSVIGAPVSWGGSGAVDVENRSGEGFRSLLRQVVPDAALDGAVLIRAGESPGVGARVRMRGAVGVTFQGDRRHRDDRGTRQPLLQGVVLRIPVGQSQAPSVVVDHDLDVVRVVEGGRAAGEGGIVEVPLRGCRAPD